MASSGVGNLDFIDDIMNKYVYLDIFKRNLMQRAIRLGISGHIKLYQDNDPKHAANICKLCVFYHCPSVIQTPTQISDLNPIEHVLSCKFSMVSGASLGPDKPDPCPERGAAFSIFVQGGKTTSAGPDVAFVKVVSRFSLVVFTSPKLYPCSDHASPPSLPLVSQNAPQVPREHTAER
ncbi:DDE_3 domain-containing protein [Trichonephila clavipes]|nr:DDE_3 domain-containing protein [Trichonephila clavipes]